jgi:hypothetical protein
MATLCHPSVGWVNDREETDGWPPDVQQAVHDGWLSVSAASNLALIDDSAYRRFLLSQAKQTGATDQTTAEWVQAWQWSGQQQGPTSAETTPAFPVPSAIVAVPKPSGGKTPSVNGGRTESEQRTACRVGSGRCQ